MTWFDLLMRHLLVSHVFALPFVVFMADSDIIVQIYDILDQN